MRPHEILGVSAEAAPIEIKHAYRRLVKEVHPDLHAMSARHSELLGRINTAYATLMQRNRARPAPRATTPPRPSPAQRPASPQRPATPPRPAADAPPRDAAARAARQFYAQAAREGKLLNTEDIVRGAAASRFFRSV